MFVLPVRDLVQPTSDWLDWAQMSSYLVYNGCHI